MRRARRPRAPSVIRSALLSVGAIATVGLVAAPPLQVSYYPLVSPVGLRLHKLVAVEPSVLEGKKGLRVTMSGADPQIVPILDIEFGDGNIAAEVAGAPAPGAPANARGSVGIAFRLQDDMKTYEAFYLRPANGRADDQERRNHSVQYVSHPGWPWFRLRKESPSKYEAYVDLQPAVWTKVKIEVEGARARLHVHDQEQPTLIVNDLKTGAHRKGRVALWLDQGTVAHFRELRVEPSSAGDR